ncbi:Uncharacterised protein [Candidatus Ornithobacterium hominis]|nr:Uncharacterised protein [Candidatus Ornithobacterium hominis]
MIKIVLTEVLKFYNEIIRLSKKKKLPKSQLIYPNCGEIVDCQKRTILGLPSLLTSVGCSKL